jgi:hypothetical protein
MTGMIEILEFLFDFYYFPSCLGLFLFVCMRLFESIFAHAYFRIGIWAVS